jgi:phosphoribosylanthranilate isomerase
MTRTKICGLTEIDHALAAADSGADYIGLVFAPSRRQITPEKASRIIKALRFFKSRPAAVGVFVNLPSQEVNSISESCGLDYVQLSGDETFEYCREIKLPVIKTIHVSGDNSSKDIEETIARGNHIVQANKLTFLLDTQSVNSFGGTGLRFNWRIAKEISSSNQVIIAGGLSLENVGQLLKEASPWGVDVSSGVETEGKKDIYKIREFIKIVRSFKGGK